MVCHILVMSYTASGNCVIDDDIPSDSETQDAGDDIDESNSDNRGDMQTH